MIKTVFISHFEINIDEEYEKLANEIYFNKDYEKEILFLNSGLLDIYIYNFHTYNDFLNDLKNAKIKVYTKLEMTRKNLGLTRKELSILSGVSIRTIEAFEQGLRNEDKMNLDTYKKLYSALGKKFINF